MFECLWVSKVKELESTVEKQRNDIRQLQDELQMTKPSNFSEFSHFMLIFVCTVNDINVGDWIMLL